MQSKKSSQKQDYISYWNSKGDYGKNRVMNMRKRKQARFEKWMYKSKNRGFKCEMGWHSCELRGYCNGDC